MISGHAFHAILWTVAAAPWGIAIEADFQTSRGVFTVVLDPEQAPLATANFVRLAEGGSFWRDSDTGAFSSAECYDGLGVGTVVNGASERFFEVGDGSIPGYEFEDEIPPGSGHLPYGVTMATHAPNTNGAAVRIFGAVADAARDGRHTVFGQVAAGPGRAVVDAIIDGGAGATVVEKVTIRNKAASLSLLEVANQSLPSVQPVSGPLEVAPGVSCILQVQQPPSSILSVNASADLRSWVPLRTRFIDVAGSAVAGIPLDSAGRPRSFYRAALATYPGDPPGIDSLGGSTIEIAGAAIATLVYEFNAGGTGGTFRNVISTTPPPLVFSGTFTVDPPDSVRLMPHSLALRVRTQGLGGAEFQWIRVGWDEDGPTGPSGRHVTRLLNSAGELIFEDSGPASWSGN